MEDGLEEEVRQGAGREERGKERKRLVDGEAGAAPKARAKRRKREPSSEPHIFVLDAEFLFGCQGLPSLIDLTICPVVKSDSILSLLANSEHSGKYG